MNYGMGTTYEWDAEDRLVAVNAGTNRSEISYNGLGQRIRMVEKNNGSITSNITYLWTSGSIAEERDSTGGVVTKRYLAGGMMVGATKYYFTTDHLTSVREVTDSSGNVVSRFDYDPYGNRSQVSGTFDPGMGFTSHFHHSSGLVLTWYRAYDPLTARWLSRDPIGEIAGTNLYAYIGGNPLGDIDPLGLWPAGYDNEEQWNDAMRDSGHGGWYRFANRVGNSVSAIGNAAGSALGISEYDPELQRNANPLSRADCQGGAVRAGTYGAVGVAGIAAAIAGGAIGAEIAAMLPGMQSMTVGMMRVGSSARNLGGLLPPHFYFGTGGALMHSLGGRMANFAASTAGTLMVNLPILSRYADRVLMPAGSRTNPNCLRAAWEAFSRGWGF